jgi:hypothetical protein
MRDVRTALAFGYGPGYTAPVTDDPTLGDLDRQERSQNALRSISGGYGPGTETEWPVLEGPLVKTAVGDLDVIVQTGRAADGRLIATAVAIGWGPRKQITARTLRDVRLGQILASVSTQQYESATNEGRTAATALVENSPTARVQRPGPGGHPAEHYEDVAVRYRQAVQLAPHRPVAHLATELHASPATVYRWLAIARERGLLERTARRGPATGRPSMKRENE